MSNLAICPRQSSPYSPPTPSHPGGRGAIAAPAHLCAPAHTLTSNAVPIPSIMIGRKLVVVAAVLAAAALGANAQKNCISTDIKVVNSGAKVAQPVNTTTAFDQVSPQGCIAQGCEASMKRPCHGPKALWVARVGGLLFHGPWQPLLAPPQARPATPPPCSSPHACTASASFHLAMPAGHHPQRRCRSRAAPPFPHLMCSPTPSPPLRPPAHRLLHSRRSPWTSILRRCPPWTTSAGTQSRPSRASTAAARAPSW